MTEKLYYKDNKLKECNAVVLKINYNKEKKYSEVILDKTIFYPEGGGQPADFGTIDGLQVFDVQNVNGEVVHFVKGELKETEVKCVLDFNRRFDLMQQHTGQHLLSQIVMDLFKGQTLSFHLGEDYSTIEIGLNQFSNEHITETESKLAEKIFENLLIKTYVVKSENDVPFRKPPKVKENIRVVEIDKFDYNACGGIHLNSTGGLGLVKIIKTDRIRGNVRLYFMCGYRALKDYTKKHKQVADIYNNLSASPKEVISIVSNLKSENYNLKKQLEQFKKDSFNVKLNSLLKLNKKVVIHYFENATIKDLRELAVKSVENGKNAFFFSNNFAVIASLKENDKLKELGVEIFNELKGKGGGTNTVIQGKISDLSFIDSVKEKVEKFFV